MTTQHRSSRFGIAAASVLATTLFAFAPIASATTEDATPAPVAQVARIDLPQTRVEVRKAAVRPLRERAQPTLGQLLDGYNP